MTITLRWTTRALLVAAAALLALAAPAGAEDLPFVDGHMWVKSAKPLKRAYLIALAILSVLLGALPASAQLVQLGDVNGDGSVDLTDALELGQFLAGTRPNLARADLADVMGGRSRVSEFFSGKRDLSKGQIEGLMEMLKIPADLLLGR